MLPPTIYKNLKNLFSLYLLLCYIVTIPFEQISCIHTASTQSSFCLNRFYTSLQFSSMACIHASSVSSFQYSKSSFHIFEVRIDVSLVFVFVRFCSFNLSLWIFGKRQRPTTTNRSRNMAMGDRNLRGYSNSLTRNFKHPILSFQGIFLWNFWKLQKLTKISNGNSKNRCNSTKISGNFCHVDIICFLLANIRTEIPQKNPFALSVLKKKRFTGEFRCDWMGQSTSTVSWANFWICFDRVVETASKVEIWQKLGDSTLPSQKLTAKAPENRPKWPQKETI